MCSYTRQRRKRQGGTSDAVFYQVVFGVPWAAISLETEYVGKKLLGDKEG